MDLVGAGNFGAGHGENNFHHDNNVIHNDFPYGDANSMSLSEEERNWGLEIKEALRQAACTDEELVSAYQHVSDMEVAQFAIVKYRGNVNGVEQIVEMLYKMQCFREIFDIQETVTDGMECLEAFMEQQPGFLLDCSYLPSEGCWHSCFDYSKLNASVLAQSPEQYRIFHLGMYYIMKACSADFRGIRTGIINLSECDGMGFANFNARVFEKMCLELWIFYPMNYKQIVWINTPLVANICYSIVKKVVSKEMAESWRVGEKLPFEGRLNELYEMPTPQHAKQVLLTKLHKYITSRFQNQRNFSLSSSAVPGG